MQLFAEIQSFDLAEPFRIARGVYTSTEVVYVEVSAGGVIGRGEASGVDYHGDTPARMLQQVRSVQSALDAGLTRQDLQSVLPPGGARNALDCALWDFEAKRAGTDVARLAGLPPLKPIRTAQTVPIDTPQAMAAKAARIGPRALLKIKLGAPEGDDERMRAIRAAVPHADLVVDANQGWNADTLAAMIPVLEACGVQMIEQPLPAGQDRSLRDIKTTIPICADESCVDRSSLDALAGLYTMVNVKLDKTGGLTEALALCAAAQARGFGLMLGCMIGTSLAAAPGLVAAQLCSVVDLDCPLLLKTDRTPSMRFVDGFIHPAEAALWG